MRHRFAIQEDEKDRKIFKCCERYMIIAIIIFVLCVIMNQIFANDLPICPLYNDTYPQCMQEFTGNPCDCFDYDYDSDVDLRDFAITQNSWRPD